MIYIRGNRATTTPGATTTAAPGGATTTCCPTSAAPRTTPAARARTTARAARCRSRTCGTSPSTPQHFIEAAIRRGALANDDFNGAQQDGVGFYQVTQRDGGRCSAADAYLASRPQNLTVITGALATGLVIEGGRAAGVTYRHAGPRRDGARRGRGHPGRRRDRHAAAADALRHRARRPPAGARHLRDRRHARRGRQPDRPPGRAGALVHPARQGPVGVHREPRLRPLEDDPQGPAHLQHRRGGRIRAQRPAAVRARPAVARPARWPSASRASPTRPGAR